MTQPASSNKPVGVIILNWNGEAMLRRYLPSVLRHTPAGLAEIIVADNGSTDGSVGLIEKEFPQVTLLRFDKNYGFAEGYNRAIEATPHRYTVLLNSDVEVADDWLTPLYRHMEANPHTAAIQPKILSATDHSAFEYAGASGGFIDRLGYPYCRGRVFDTVEKDLGQYDSTIEVDWASGAALMVRRRLYIEVGGLDPRFFAHMEEIDLCWRLRRAGYRVEACGESAVYHLGGGTLPASDPRKTYLNFRNNLLLLHKNLPPRLRRRKLFVRRLYDTLAVFRFIAGGDFDSARAVVKAHNDFRRMAPDFAVSRDTENLLAARPNIIWEYYGRRKKCYSDLCK